MAEVHSTATSSVTRIFFTMNNLLYREALVYQALQQDDLLIVGESETGVETLSLLASTGADLLVIEEDLTDNDGLTVAELALARQPSLNILLLVNAHVSQQRLAIYLESGIKSVVTLHQPLQAFMKALNYVRRGQVFVGADVYPAKVSACQLHLLDALSDREKEVALMLARRIEIKSIADHLGVSYKTVHSYKDRIFVKMGFERLPELILFMNRIRRGTTG